MVPLSTHQQLLAEKYRDPEFRASLDTRSPTVSNVSPGSSTRCAS